MAVKVLATVIHDKSYIKEYLNYLQKAKEIVELGTKHGKIHTALEKKLAPFYGAVNVGGNDAKHVGDFHITDDETAAFLNKQFDINQKTSGTATHVEAKFRQINIPGGVSVKEDWINLEKSFTAGKYSQVEFGTDSSKEALSGLGKYATSGDIFAHLPMKVKKSIYNKVKLLNINYMVGASVYGITIHIPFTEFKSPPIKFRYKAINRKSTTGENIPTSYTLAVSLDNSYERGLLRAISSAGQTLSVENLEDVRKLFNSTISGTKKRQFTYSTKPNKQNVIVISVPHTNSIPLGTAHVKVDTRKLLKAPKPRAKEQKFISALALTNLTQDRLGKTMKKAGPAVPPFLHERMGRFRSSVETFVNYRANMVSFTYNPLYKANEDYGYLPSVQVGIAIREVLATLYTRNFLIREI